MADDAPDPRVDADPSEFVSLKPGPQDDAPSLADNTPNGEEAEVSTAPPVEPAPQEEEEEKKEDTDDEALGGGGGGEGGAAEEDKEEISEEMEDALLAEGQGESAAPEGQEEEEEGAGEAAEAPEEDQASAADPAPAPAPALAPVADNTASGSASEGEEAEEPESEQQAKEPESEQHVVPDSNVEQEAAEDDGVLSSGESSAVDQSDRVEADASATEADAEEAVAEPEPASSEAAAPQVIEADSTEKPEEAQPAAVEDTGSNAEEEEEEAMEQSEEQQLSTESADAPEAPEDSVAKDNAAEGTASTEAEKSADEPMEAEDSVSETPVVAVEGSKSDDESSQTTAAVAGEGEGMETDGANVTAEKSSPEEMEVEETSQSKAASSEKEPESASEDSESKGKDDESESDSKAADHSKTIVKSEPEEKTVVKTEKENSEGQTDVKPASSIKSEKEETEKTKKTEAGGDDDDDDDIQITGVENVAPKGKTGAGKPAAKSERNEELKGYAADTMNEFLDMLGMEKLDEKEKGEVKLGERFQVKDSGDKKGKENEKAKEGGAAEAGKKSEESTTTKPDKGKHSKQQQQCIVCKKVGKCKYNIVRNGDIKHLCDDSCFKTFRANPTSYLRPASPSAKNKAPATAAAAAAPTTAPPAAKTAESQKSKEDEVVQQKTCASCKKYNANVKYLNWQAMDFCCEDCLSSYQSKMASTCGFCNTAIGQSSHAKFVMKVGSEMKQFCNNSCTEDYKKKLKLCAFCQKDVTTNPDGFMAPISGSGEFKDFCSQDCLKQYEKQNEDTGDDVEIIGTSKITGPRTRASSGLSTCAVCGKMSSIKHEVNYDGKMNRMCGDACFAAFRYAKKLTMNMCDNCGVYCLIGPNSTHFIQYEGNQKRFCSSVCVNTFKNKCKKIVPCAWCQTKKSNFDMIERVDANNKYQLFCTLNCLSLYRVNLQATSNQSVMCDHCRKYAPAQYHLTMSDASVRNFCHYNCVMAFQSQFQAGGTGGARAASKAGTAVTPPVAQKTQTQTPVRQTARQQALAAKQKAHTQNNIPVISSVMSLAPQNQATAATPPGRTPVAPRAAQATVTPPVRMQNAGTQFQQQVIVQPPPPKQVKNKSLLCKPFTQTKATSCRPHTQTKETQTDEELKPKTVIIPVPIPFYIPVPMAMYTMPTPFPVPFPIPIPVPQFIPTTKRSSESILKHIKEIQERMPSDPFEAELLMMAEAVATAEKGSESESEKSDDEDNSPNQSMSTAPTKDSDVATTVPNPSAPPGAQQDAPVIGGGLANPGGVLGEDMLQMALRMASEMTEPVMDLEASIEAQASMPEQVMPSQEYSTIDQNSDILTTVQAAPPSASRSRRGAKRSGGGRGRGRSKRQRVEEPAHDTQDQVPPAHMVPQAPPPDANMVLKYTYGVNAWKHWVLQKNAQLEKASKSSSRLKLFKTDILQCTADELNYSLCLFVKEVRKPNCEEYAPDSIYYLCLGIQQYLFENGRIDNIFTDIYYEKFTECLNEVVQRYEIRLNAQGMIVCRIEEEHLWESKQLGAHSPHVLLNTLIYFNTKYFNLRSAEEHLRLSFSHIMKHWKKTNHPGSKTPGRSVYLRYCAPIQNGRGNDPKKKREESPVYEQGENVDNPLRCPVKLYEFYLSKCPESIKNRNDVFYLVPERSCVPDSPVWYSTSALGVEQMQKMLNRIRMIRDVQTATNLIE